MRKIILTCALLAGLAAALRAPETLKQVIRISRNALPGWPDRALQVADHLPSSRILRNEYLEISLGEPGEATLRHLALLGEGLASEDEGTRRSAAAYVENLLVVVAHGQQAVHPDNQRALTSLIALYKNHATDQIMRMQRNFPQSPTLAYLQNN